jgi:hypothetical protein
MLLFLSNNKLLLHDQLTFYFRIACIFFVLNNDPNGMSEILVYFLSRQHRIRSFLLYHSNKLILHDTVVLQSLGP